MSESKVPRGFLPSWYSFVPKGNVFITSNCRKLTHARDSSVYVVIDAKNQQIGIGVPTEIYVAVQFKEMETRAERAANVLKRDQQMANGFQKEIMKIFPQIPPDALRNVARIAMQKGKGKVGRVGKLGAHRKARLAVWAHVRHRETDYDMLLRNGLSREDARQFVEPKIIEVCKAWAAGTQPAREGPDEASKSRGRPSTAVSQASKKADQGSQGQPKKHAQVSTLTTATANAGKPKTTKKAAPISKELRMAVRNAKRAHRQKQSPMKLVKENTQPTTKKKAAPKASSPPATVVATAASFRERRTPKPRSILPTEPGSPSSPKIREERAKPTVPNLKQEHRAQILRLAGRIEDIERAQGACRKKQLQRLVTEIFTIADLHSRINGILTCAEMQAIDCSAEARQDLVRRLSGEPSVSEEDS